MKSFSIREFGIGNLRLEDVPKPEPGYGQVLVRMTAASLNYRDLMVVKGLYNPKMKLPMIPLSDGAGTVEANGPGTGKFKAGDRVAGCFMQGWINGRVDVEKARTALGGAIDGVLSEYKLFSENGVVHAPAGLSDEETATLPCAALTAWHALFEERRPVPGETVLLLGTGGVSIFALQFAVAAGLRTIITSSSDDKLQRARKLGAHDTINYEAVPNWEDEARRLTGGRGVDHVIEVGGGDTLPRSLKAVKMAGTVSVIGALTGGQSTVSPVPILMNTLNVQGIYVGSRAMFERMNSVIEQKSIKPVIDRVFPWTEFPEALRHMESQSHFGKICLRF